MFCGFDGKLDKEHVIADWIGEELPLIGKGQHQRTRAFGVVEAEWENEMHTSRVGTVCPACNQGWMSALEAEVRPWLLPILHKRGRAYYKAGMTALATWAVKTALVISSDSASFPREPFERFFEDRKPSSDTRVWLGAWVFGPHKHYRTRAPVRLGGGDPEAPNAYSVTFTVGYGAFHVFQHWSGSPSRYGFAPPLSDRLLPIWPVASEPVTWPPLPPLTEAELDAIGNAHGEVFVMRTPPGT